jgi:hypothetical protein
LAVIQAILDARERPEADRLSRVGMEYREKAPRLAERYNQKSCFLEGMHYRGLMRAAAVAAAAAPRNRALRRALTFLATR